MAIPINIEERVQKAVALFDQGYTCAQSIVLAYSDVFDLDDELAKKISAPFASGMGKLREVCGTVSGMIMLIGLRYPATSPSNKRARVANYNAVQRVVGSFKDDFTTIHCKELMQVIRNRQLPEQKLDYPVNCPCSHFIAKAAEIVGKEIRK